MADYAIPKNGVAYILYVSLPSQANPLIFQVNPTIAAGDFKVSIDGGAFTNLATLPVVTPAGGKMVKISLSSGEMTGDNISVVASDVAGAEWCDQSWVIQTAPRSVGDLAFPVTTGRGLAVDASNRIDLGAWLGAAPNALIGGRVDANAQVVGDKTNYSLSAAEETAIASAVATRIYEGALTYEQVVRIMLSALGGIVSGAATTTMHFRDQANSKDRITATVDASGNRSAVTVDGT